MRRSKRPVFIIFAILLVVLVILYSAVFVAYQNTQREAAGNAQTLAYEINLTVVATLTP